MVSTTSWSGFLAIAIFFSFCVQGVSHMHMTVYENLLSDVTVPSPAPLSSMFTHLRTLSITGNVHALPALSGLPALKQLSIAGQMCVNPCRLSDLQQLEVSAAVY